jgi:hypothetical protein
MTKAEKREKLLNTLRELAEPKTHSDIEANHAKADDALLEYINDKDITEAYKKIEKWYA